MRVLWFTNIELPAVCRRLSSPVPGGGGWLESLRSALGAHDSVQLAVAAMGSNVFQPFVENGVEYFHLEAPTARSRLSGVANRWRHRLDDRSAIEGALAVVEGFEPDLVHVHGTEGPFGLLREVTHVPLVISLQGLLVVCARAYCTGIPVTDIVRDVMSVEFAKGWGLVHSSMDMRIAAQREVRIMKACHFFTGRTEWDRSVLSVVNPDARYYRACDVLRPEFYGHEWRPASGGPFVVYAIGSTAPYKGLVNLLEAVALLRDSVRPSVQLRVSGDLGANMWPIAHRAVRRLRLEKSVVWLGPLPTEAIVSELRAASVYVHPSVVDNSPNALGEAMMVGTPCVASSAGGIPSMITDGEDGLLCAPDDVFGLAGRIAAVEEDAALAVRLGQKARARAQRRHDPSAVAMATVEIYADVLARHGSGER